MEKQVRPQTPAQRQKYFQKCEQYNVLNRTDQVNENIPDPCEEDFLPNHAPAFKFSLKTYLKYDPSQNAMADNQEQLLYKYSQYLNIFASYFRLTSFELDRIFTDQSLMELSANLTLIPRSQTQYRLFIFIEKFNNDYDSYILKNQKGVVIHINLYKNICCRSNIANKYLLGFPDLREIIIYDAGSNASIIGVEKGFSSLRHRQTAIFYFRVFKSTEEATKIGRYYSMSNGQMVLNGKIFYSYYRIKLNSEDRYYFTLMRLKKALYSDLEGEHGRIEELEAECHRFMWEDRIVRKYANTQQYSQRITLFDSMMLNYWKELKTYENTIMVVKDMEEQIDDEKNPEVFLMKAMMMLKGDILRAMQEVKVDIESFEEINVETDHFPIQMEYEKNCFYCVMTRDRKGRDPKAIPKKTSYKCAACSKQQKWQVSLCIGCWIEFHHDRQVTVKYQKRQKELAELQRKKYQGMSETEKAIEFLKKNKNPEPEQLKKIMDLCYKNNIEILEIADELRKEKALDGPRIAEKIKHVNMINMMSLADKFIRKTGLQYKHVEDKTREESMVEQSTIKQQSEPPMKSEQMMEGELEPKTESMMDVEVEKPESMME